MPSKTNDLQSISRSISVICFIILLIWLCWISDAFSTPDNPTDRLIIVVHDYQELVEKRLDGEQLTPVERSKLNSITRQLDDLYRRAR